MKADAAKKFGLTPSIEDHDFNPLQLAEDKFFNQNNCKDYRRTAIEFCVKNELDFVSTSNSIFELSRKFVVIKCPGCNGDMKVTTGGGNCNEQTMHYKCSCGIECNLTIPHDGIRIEFNTQHCALH